MRTYKALLWLALALLLLAGAPTRVSAQEPVLPPQPVPPGVPLPIEPIPPMPPSSPVVPPDVPNQVTVELHKVEAVVDGPIARVSVEQVFRNDGGQTAEGVYVFPLPKDAAVSDFQMTVNGQTLEGKLLDKEDARRLYEQIVRQRRDPALLEYIDRGLFQANVFPIPPGESRTLDFTYTQVLEQKDGLYRFNYPLRTRQYSSLPPEQVSVSVELRNQSGLRTIYSPELPIRIDRTEDDSALVTFEQSGVQPAADFDLYFGTDDSAIGLNLLSYKPAGEDGYFALLAAPSLTVPGGEVVARDVVLVVDVSGSMKGEKMEQARAAARYVVDALNPQDRFDIIAFSSATDPWSGKLQDTGAKSQETAQAWIGRLRAGGSTDINRALLEALAELEAAKEPADGEGSARPAYVLFLTDGQPTVGETDAERIVNNAENNTPADQRVRLFPFGIGYDVNTDLLDTLGSQLGGRSSYVQPDERIDEAVGSFYAQISTPVLADIALDFGDMAGVKQIFPYPLPDLFAGEQLVAVGRYAEGGKVDVELKGDVNGKERLYVYSDRDLATSGGEPFVAKLWATRRIGELLSQVRRTGAEQELIDEIVDLSLRYGIVTPYTSYLVLESGDYVPQPATTDGGSAAPAAPRAAAMDAQKGVAAAAAEAASAAPSGAAAVQASVARSSLESATTVTQNEAVRYAGGRTFQRQVNAVDAAGQPIELWVDTEYLEGMDVTEVPFGSDAYFALLDQPGMAEWLAVGPQVVIVTGENAAVRITPEK
jgi:Ca-activated chloride channel homolog